jgi:hypothetical protein
MDLELSNKKGERDEEMSTGAFLFTKIGLREELSIL